MKKYTLSAIAGALAMLISITIADSLHRNMGQLPEKYEHINYVSGVTRDECYVCSDIGGFSGFRHWGEDNIGIVNLNTFELMRLEINRYDEYGNLIEGPAGYMCSGGMSKDDAGSYAHAFSFPDNGFADAQIFGVQYAIDREFVQNHLCQTCLDSINDLWFTGQPPAEYAIISFEERTIQPLLNSHRWFSAGNYGVNCEFGENGKIDLLIHYFRNRNV